MQSPGDLVPLLCAIHGGGPRVLGEDFCGTAALSAAWVDQVDGGRAIAVDHDPEALGRAPRLETVALVAGDVVRDTGPDDHRVHVLYVGNFSIGEWHTRGELLAYLRHARSRVADGGLFVCDVYGGESAFATGHLDREHPLPDGRTVHYTWEQREANPVTGLVVDALHFEVRRGEEVELELPDAFVYRWRLWGVPELRDAMTEAGFAETAVYAKVPGAVDGDGAVYPMRIQSAHDLDESYDVLVVGRT
ncbi:MAG: class I SAM-dependent methyltransferase [Planctomycetota bacterium]